MDCIINSSEGINFHLTQPLFCSALLCSALFCSALHCVALHCIVLHFRDLLHVQAYKFSCGLLCLFSSTVLSCSLPPSLSHSLSTNQQGPTPQKSNKLSARTRDSCTSHQHTATTISYIDNLSQGSSPNPHMPTRVLTQLPDPLSLPSSSSSSFRQSTPSVPFLSSSAARPSQSWLRVPSPHQ